jgi:hypothetical protein
LKFNVARRLIIAFGVIPVLIVSGLVGTIAKERLGISGLITVPIAVALCISLLLLDAVDVA